MVPFVFHDSVGNGGTLSLNYFISRSIKKQTTYQGVLSFRFSSISSFVNPEDTVDFMYEIKDDAIVMEPVLKEGIEDGLVVARSDAITLYFEKVKEEELKVLQDMDVLQVPSQIEDVQETLVR